MTGDERAQLNAAFCRAMPVTRMLDYGMTAEQAARAHHLARQGAAWDETLESLARDAVTAARAARDDAQAWLRASACYNFAQMGFTTDTARKRALLRETTACFEAFASRAPISCEKFVLPHGGGQLFGWSCRGAAPPLATIIVLGGMSGWATAYASMAEALCQKNLACLLVDAPGQGETRLEGGIYAGADLPTAMGRFIGYALDQAGGAPVGLWGNSFGGLFAALTAAADPRVQACCINCAPTRAEAPPVRLAAEQMAAMLGLQDLTAAGPVMRALTFDPETAPLKCPVLVLEGGADPLVPVGSQKIFLNRNEHASSRKLAWADGEHTIYNHAAERNEAVTEWFEEVLKR